MRNQYPVTLRRRLFRALLPIVAIVLVLGGAGTVLLRRLGGLAGEILRENYASVVAMERFDEAIERIDSSFQFALAGQENFAAAQYEARWPDAIESLRIEQSNITLPGEKEAVDRLSVLLVRYRASGDAFYARPPGDPQRRAAYFDPEGLLATFSEMKAGSRQVLTMNQAAMETASRRAEITAAVSATGLAVGLAAALLLSTFLAWRTERALVAPIKALTRSAVAVAQGDLEQRVIHTSPDELGELAKAFNSMTERLRSSRRAVDERTAELRQAEEKYRSIVENAVEGIFQSTPDGRYVMVNHALAQMLGYESGEDLMRSVQHIGEQTYADPERRIELARRLVQEGFVRDFEVLAVRKDGAKVWLSYSTRAVRDENGNVLLYEGFISDLTARKRAEAEVVRLAQQLTRAQHIAHLGSWQLDLVRERLSWSEEVFRIFGVPRDTALTYETFLAAVHPEDRNRVDRAWGAAMRGAPYDIEHRIVVPTGGGSQIKWVRERAEVTFDSHGRAIEGLGTVQDITERKAAEARLQQLNRALRALSSCNHALVRAKDEIEWMNEVCRLIVDEAGYRLCWVGRAEDDEGKSVTPIAAAGFDEGYLASARISWADTERGRGPTGSAIRTRSVVISKNIAGDPSLAPWRAEALRRGYGSNIAIPIVIGETCFGALTIYAAEPDAFSEPEVLLLSELADDLAYGLGTLRTRIERDTALRQVLELNADLENRVARRTADLRAAHEREASIGARIQQQLLLDEPPHDMPGLTVAALTVPSQRISGDFYGFFRHEGKYCLDMLVADVMGKGVPAALLGAATKSHFPEALWHLMTASADGALPPPREIVTLAHTHLARQLMDIESFVTLCYARILIAERRLELVDCGHTGVLHMRPRSERCDQLHGENLPFGVREGEIYGQLSLPLEPDDLIVCYSDGVTEARNPEGELFGVDRLVASVRQSALGSPSEVVRAVRDAVVTFCGGSALRDDLTCVVAKLVPYERPLSRSDVSIGSSLTELRRARAFVTDFCRGLTAPLSEGRLAALILAVDEAVSNVIKHAYHGRDDQRIDITAEAFHDRVSIRLRYQGAPFDPRSVPSPSFDGSRESGFGVFMIEKSVDSVRYYRDDLRRSCIRLEKLREAA